MGYEIDFTIPIEKVDKKFKPNYTNSNDLEEQINNLKREIAIFCLSEHKDDVYNVLKSLKFKVNLLINLLTELEKSYIWNTISKDGKIWFCGWQYSHDNNSTITNKELAEKMIDWLSIYALVIPTPNYYEESERFCDKWNDINNELNVDDIIIENLDKEFVSMYRKEYGNDGYEDLKKELEDESL